MPIFGRFWINRYHLCVLVLVIVSAVWWFSNNNSKYYSMYHPHAHHFSVCELTLLSRRATHKKRDNMERKWGQASERERERAVEKWMSKEWKKSCLTSIIYELEMVELCVTTPVTKNSVFFSLCRWLVVALVSSQSTAKETKTKLPTSETDTKLAYHLRW